MRMAKRPSTEPEPNWRDQRHRVLLLPENPHFQQWVQVLRDDLGVPSEGFSVREDALDWLYSHLRRHKPYLMPKREFEEREIGYRRQLSEHRLREEVKRLGKGLPLVEGVKRLLYSFRLPRIVFGPLVWHVLAGHQVSVDRASTVVVEEVFPPGDDPADIAEYEGYWRGLPEEAGDLVVVRLVVNAYTTKREMVDEAWKVIKEIRDRHLGGKPAARRRRAGPKVEGKQLQKWLKWYRAWYAGDKPVEGVAEDFGKAFETVRYGIRELDKLMKPRSGENTNR